MTLVAIIVHGGEGGGCSDVWLPALPRGSRRLVGLAISNLEPRTSKPQMAARPVLSCASEVSGWGRREEGNSCTLPGVVNRR